MRQPRDKKGWDDNQLDKEVGLLICWSSGIISLEFKHFSAWGNGVPEMGFDKFGDPTFELALTRDLEIP
jgi:hypothetical protein